MPALTNPRQERFAQELAQGKSASQALLAAGITGFRSQAKPVGYYVYVLIDPRSDSVFYVGKGKGRRMHEHYRQWLAGAEGVNEHKIARIGEICRDKRRPLAVWLADGLSEPEAYRAERHVIFSIGIENLCNRAGTPLPALDRVALQARVDLTRQRPYCRMFNLRPSVYLQPGWEHLYWGVTAALVDISRMVGDAPRSKIPAKAHFDAWRKEVDKEIVSANAS